MNKYAEGSLVSVSGVFTSSGTVQNTTALLTIDSPSETVEYVFGVNGIITNPSTGTYSANLDTTKGRGLWLYTWWSTGTIQADSGEQEFQVI